MFGKILYLSDTRAFLENTHGDFVNGDLLNMHVIFEHEDQKILGEVSEVKEDHIEIKFLGQFVNGIYYSGIVKKANLSSKIRVINSEELLTLIGKPEADTVMLGNSTIYKGFKVCPKINDLFSSHICILGNSGSGKTWGVARLIQNILNNPYQPTFNASVVFFDSFGEYKNAFKGINNINKYYNYKFMTINKTDDSDVDIRIPVNLLTVDDYAILLQADKHSELTLIAEALKNAKTFSSRDEKTTKYKNHIIAKALLSILYSNNTSQDKKDKIFSVIEICHTNEFNFDSVIQGLGFTRTFSECFIIDSKGEFGEETLITEYILKHIDNTAQYEEVEEAFFTLEDYLKALEFTLISEGFLNNKNLYDEGELLKVRLSHIINSNIKDIFVGDKCYSLSGFINDLVTINNKKAQIININLENIDDMYAKAIVKIFSKLIFDFAKTNTNRASMPFHLFLEEAHRYIQHDNDVYLLGYNIFERIAKEGRKYGAILGIISQRPVEISDTVISQCANFLIFKMTHTVDLKYIEDMIPKISSEILEKIKILQPGTSVAFGSAFKIPWICQYDKPNPAPYSSSCDVFRVWGTGKETATTVENEVINNNVLDTGLHE